MLILISLASLACNLSTSDSSTWRLATLRAMERSAPPGSPQPEDTEEFPFPTLPKSRFTPIPTRDPKLPILTPTSSNGRILPTLRTDQQEYTVQPNDTLALISRKYGIDLNTLVKINKLADPNLLEIGQVLVIPPPVSKGTGPSFKVIPDSELVFGPASADFDLAGFIRKKNGYLSSFKEKVNDEMMSGAQIVDRVAREFSVNPRLLLAVLEYQSKWVTQKNPGRETINYPVFEVDNLHQGLYLQLSWAANNLNRGYYLWQVNAISHWLLADGVVLLPDTTINAGTAGVQYLMSQIYDLEDWKIAVGKKGVFTTYQNLFGYPFDYTVDPLVPADLKQPPMQLPFERGEIWSFTGGPHGGWGDGSGWAAIDFAPPGDAFGCVESDAWVTSVAKGVIIRSGHGVVVLDLDGDGFEQTDWTVLFLHIATRDRIPTGTIVKAGDRIGHPSCEGGVSNGTHVHLARRYNGEWISADGLLPFNLDGWISAGTGTEYNGYLKRNGKTVEAWDSRKPENQIQR